MRFHLVRYFTVTSLFAFVVVAFSLNLVQEKVQTDALIEMEEHQNVNLTRIISNSIWREFDFLVNESSGLSDQELVEHPEMQRVLDLTKSMLKGIQVVKVKVFDLQGRTVFSTDLSQVGEQKSGNSGFMSALNGKTASALSHKDTIDAFEGTKSDLDVVSSYIPVYNTDTGEIEGVFEIYADVTHFLHELHNTHYLIVGGIAGFLGLLFLVLLAIVKRASTIIKNQDLENQNSRMQLAQSEKMASLGNMVASVAHELNTPLAFTKSNVELATAGLSSLKLPVHCGSKLMEYIRNSDSDKIKLRIRDARLRVAIDGYEDEMELDDIIEMLSQTQTGLDQMAELVSHLKNFTRIDRSEVDDFDINSGLDNVLYIAKATIPENIKIVKQYGDIPTIKCMPSKLNQVFINLINNAAQAIEHDAGEITIRSSLDGEFVTVEFEDNGKGIPDSELEHIFDAYYTTKGSRDGTGLGLSIVKDIIDQHAGKLSVRSTLGTGTVFTIQLPAGVVPELKLAS